MNSNVHAKVKKPNSGYYYKGLELVCKKHFSQKGVRLFINYIYVIESITKTYFTVREPVDDVVINFIFPNDTLTKYFKLSYANTCHSVQGMSISEPITIFNANIDSHVDRHFVWTAITRSTDFKNITMFIHSDKEVDRLSDARIMRYLKTKVDGYKIQDSNKARVMNANYVNAQWILNQYKQAPMCAYRQVPFEFDIDEDENMTSNLSVDRRDNSKLYKPARKHYPTRHVLSDFPDDVWSIDLADMNDVINYNNKYRYMVNCVDCFSRFAWSVPITQKTAPKILAALQLMVKENNNKYPMRIWVDQGSEFYNSDVKKWLDEYDIDMYSTFGHAKSAVVERFNRIIKTIIYKHFFVVNNKKWVNILPEMIKQYNDTPHKGIGGLTPTKAHNLKDDEIRYLYD